MIRLEALTSIRSTNLHLPVLGSQLYSAMPGFHSGAKNLNSSPHAYSVIASPMEPFPQPDSQYFLKKTNSRVAGP